MGHRIKKWVTAAFTLILLVMLEKDENFTANDFISRHRFRRRWRMVL